MIMCVSCPCETFSFDPLKTCDISLQVVNIWANIILGRLNVSRSDGRNVSCVDETFSFDPQKTCDISLQVVNIWANIILGRLNVSRSDGGSVDFLIFLASILCVMYI